MTLATAPPAFRPPELDDDMMIVVPYVAGMLHTETIDAVTRTRTRSRYVQIDPDDPYEYGRILTACWNVGLTLVVLEQDVVPPTQWISRFRSCPRHFCTYPYDCDTDTPAYGLGCARFHAKLQATWPSLMEQAARSPKGTPYGTHWKALNERVLDLCKHFASPAHLHQPGAIHLHDYAGEANRAATAAG